MNSIKLSNYIRENHKANGRSLSNRRLLSGVGINDADYCVTVNINGNRVWCQAYKIWMGMISRSYDESMRDKRKTYAGVTVCDEWLSFMAFREWWVTNSVDGWDLDKDLLSDGRVYSPSTCLYVPRWLNVFTTDCGACRGAWPIGVTFHKRDGKFQARCSNPTTGISEFLGYFKNKEDAHQAWLNRKIEIALELKPKMDAIDNRVYARVIELIESIR